MATRPTRAAVLASSWLQDSSVTLEAVGPRRVGRTLSMESPLKQALTALSIAAMVVVAGAVPPLEAAFVQIGGSVCIGDLTVGCLGGGFAIEPLGTFPPPAISGEVHKTGVFDFNPDPVGEDLRPFDGHVVASASLASFALVIRQDVAGSIFTLLSGARLQDSGFLSGPSSFDPPGPCGSSPSCYEVGVRMVASSTRPTGVTGAARASGSVSGNIGGCSPPGDVNLGFTIDCTLHTTSPLGIDVELDVSGGLFNATQDASYSVFFFLPPGVTWTRESGLPTPSPVPEAGSFVLLGSGLVGLIGVVRRRHRRA